MDGLRPSDWNEFINHMENSDEIFDLYYKYDFCEYLGFHLMIVSIFFYQILLERFTETAQM